MKKRVARKPLAGKPVRRIGRTAPRPPLPPTDPLPDGERWAELAGGIALRALLEYREPFRRPAVRRHLPDLALADPLLPDETGHLTHRLLERDLDWGTIDALLTDERPKHQKRDLQTHLPKFDTLKLRLRQDFDEALDKASKSRDWDDWYRVSTILSAMAKAGGEPTEEQRERIRQGIGKALDAALDKASKSRDWGDWWMVSEILSTMEKVGAEPTEEQRARIRQGIGKALDAAIDKASKSRDWGDWWMFSTILDLMEKVGAEPTDAHRRAIDRALDAALEKASKSRDGSGWDTVSRILSAMARLGLVRAFVGGSAMTLAQVEEALHQEGADFAAVPPLQADVPHQTARRGGGSTR